MGPHPRPYGRWGRWCWSVFPDDCCNLSIRGGHQGGEAQFVFGEVVLPVSDQYLVLNVSWPYLHGDLLHDLLKHRYEAHQSVDPCVLSPFCEIRENVSLFPVIRDFIWSPPIFKYKAEPLGNNISQFQFPQDAGVNLIRTHGPGAIVLHQAASVQFYFRPFRHCLRLSKSVSQKSMGKRAATNDLNNSKEFLRVRLLM